MKNKKNHARNLAIMAVFVFCGFFTAACGNKTAVSDTSGFQGIPIDTERAESVSVYYGSICYSFYSEEREKIDQVAEVLQGFSLKEAPEETLDPAATYEIYFSAANEQIAAVNVDKNGIFYLPEEKKYYVVEEGEFSFGTLDQIYRDDMHINGFDENQCLIP